MGEEGYQLSVIGVLTTDDRQLITRGNVKPMITEVIPLDEAQRAFDSLHQAENIAVLLKP